MAEETQTSSGVQDLISRIRDDGVQAGKQEAERILADAQLAASHYGWTAVLKPAEHIPRLIVDDDWPADKWALTGHGYMLWSPGA